MSGKKVYTPEQDLQIVRLIAEGKTVKEVAASMQLKPQAIEDRLRKLRKREKAKSMAHLVAIMKDKGQIGMQ